MVCGGEDIAAMDTLFKLEMVMGYNDWGDQRKDSRIALEGF
jgi:hypothetical protein